MSDDIAFQIRQIRRQMEEQQEQQSSDSSDQDCPKVDPFLFQESAGEQVKTVDVSTTPAAEDDLLDYEEELDLQAGINDPLDTQPVVQEEEEDISWIFTPPFSPDLFCVQGGTWQPLQMASSGDDDQGTTSDDSDRSWSDEGLSALLRSEE